MEESKKEGNVRWREFADNWGLLENNYVSMNGANVSAVSVYEYSVSLDCNRSFRPNMEDGN